MANVSSSNTTTLYSTTQETIIQPGAVVNTGQVGDANFTTLYSNGINQPNVGNNLTVLGNLRVLGSSDLEGPVTIGNSYTMPTSDGLAGQVITTDGNGNLSFTVATGVGKTYDISAAVVSGGANLNLNSNVPTTDSVKFAAGAGMTVVATDANTITISNVSPGTTYTIDASTTTGGANFNLVGSDLTTDTIKFSGSGATTVTQTNANEITISSTNTNTTYDFNASSTTGGVNLNLVGSDSTTDTVKLSNGTGVTVSYVSGTEASIAIGQDVATTANPTFAGATLGNVTVGIATDNTISTTTGNLTITNANGQAGTTTFDSNISATSTTVNAHTFTKNSSVTNNGLGVINIISQSTGTPAVGFGPYILATSELGNGDIQTVGSIGWRATDMTPNAENFQVEIAATKAGALPDYKFYIDSDGNISADGNLTLNVDQTAATSYLYANSGAVTSNLSWDGTAWTFANDLIVTGDIQYTGGDLRSTNVATNFSYTGTGTHTFDIDNINTASGFNKQIRIGGNGQSSSTTIVEIGNSLTTASSTVNLYNAVNVNGTLRLFDTGTVNNTGFIPNTSGGTINYYLPNAQGAAATVLTNDGAGNLSWQLPGGGGSQFGNITVGIVTDNTISTTTGDLILDSATNLVKVNADLDVTGTADVDGDITVNADNTVGAANIYFKNGSNTSYLSYNILNKFDLSNPLNIYSLSGAPSSPQTALELVALTGSSPTTGFGPRLSLLSVVPYTTPPAPVTEVGFITAVMTDATLGSPDFGLNIALMNNGAAPATKLSLSSTGDLNVTGDVFANDLNSRSNLALNYDNTPGFTTGVYAYSGPSGTTQGSLTWDGTTWTVSSNETLNGYLRINGSSSGYSQFSAPATGSNLTYVLPGAAGAANTVLTNDGSGNLSWALPGGGGSTFGNITVGIVTDNTISTTTGDLILDSATNLVNVTADLTVTGDIEYTGGDLRTTNALSSFYYTGLGSHTFNIDDINTSSGNTKTISIGENGQSGSNTSINIGSSTVGATSTVNLYNNVAVAGQLNVTGDVFANDLNSRGNLSLNYDNTPAFTTGIYAYSGPSLPLTQGSLVWDGSTWTVSSNETLNGYLRINGSSSGYSQFSAPATGSNLTYVLPGAAGAANTVLTNDGSGNLTWALPGGGGSTFGNVSIGVVTDNTISTTSGDLDITSATGVINLDTYTAFTDNRLTTTSVSTVTLDSLAIATYQSASYSITIKNTVTGATQFTKIDLLHDGSVAYINQYSNMASAADLSTFSATISGANAVLQITPASTNSTQFTFNRIATKV